MRETGKAEVEDEKKDLEGEKPKPEIVKKLADDWDEEEEEEQEKRRAEEGAEQAGGGLFKLVESKISFNAKAIFKLKLLQKETRKQLKLAKRPLHQINLEYLRPTAVSLPRRNLKMWTRNRLWPMWMIFSMTLRT